MKRVGAERGTTSAAAASLILAILLAFGFFGRFSVSRSVWDAQALRVLRIYSFSLDEGRITLWSEAREVSTWVPGWHFNWTGGLLGPDLKRCFWAFDAHSLPASLVGAKGSNYLFAFPIWCALLPCLIAPLLWWRKRKRPDAPGFEVISDQT